MPKASPDRQSFCHRQFRRLVREATKVGLAPLLRWPHPAAHENGYSLVLGTPWALRPLLSVNLQFVQNQRLSEVRRIHVVFDRPPRGDDNGFLDAVRERFPHLPLHFAFHPPLAGRLLEGVNRSKFYASMNWVVGLSACATRYAILHDFDLYPLRPDFFDSIVGVLKRGYRFSGVEYATFDGLTPEDRICGSWELGVDVEWLRARFRPVDCFHRIEWINGRWVDLDPFSWLQSRTPQRTLAPGIDIQSFVHVKNLCSTFLSFSGGGHVRIAWQLHMLCYLENLVTRGDGLSAITKEMERAECSLLHIKGRDVDFSDVHVTCGNVLREQVSRMERALFGHVRPQVESFIGASERFLGRFGSWRSLPNWCARTRTYERGKVALVE